MVHFDFCRRLSLLHLLPLLRPERRKGSKVGALAKSVRERWHRRSFATTKVGGRLAAPIASGAEGDGELPLLVGGDAGRPPAATPEAALHHLQRVLARERW